MPAVGEPETEGTGAADNETENAVAERLFESDVGLKGMGPIALGLGSCSMAQTVGLRMLSWCCTNRGCILERPINSEWLHVSSLRPELS